MDRKKRAFELFEAAFDLPPDRVSEYLDSKCGDDVRLRAHVERLLAHVEHEDESKSDERPHDLASSQTQASDSIDSSSYSSCGRFLPGSQIASRYRILALVGRGASGEVYRADDLKLSIPVAIKILSPEFSADARRLENFQNEVRLSRQISHPHVCRVYDIGEFENLHYLTMEFVDGEDLKSLLRRIGSMPSGKGAEIAQHLCAGLAAAHDLNVIHRDLKPANIMIDGKGQARITDFGLARLTTEQPHSEIVGTPNFMAPEQLAHGITNVQTDLYSLGLVLHELFTGKPVYAAKTMDELRQLHDDSQHLNRTSSTRELNPLVASAIQSCLEFDPTQRPSSAREIGAAMPGGEPLSAVLAAGHTPTPDQVAASGGNTAIAPRRIAAMLAAIALGVVALLASSHLSVINQANLQEHPQILVARSKQLLRDFGYTTPPRDVEWGMEVDRRELVKNRTLNDRQPETSDSSPIYFWFRQSERVLVPLSFRDGLRRNLGRVTYGDPSLAPGMARLILNPAGQLVRFEAMPAATNSIDAPETDSERAPFPVEMLADALGVSGEDLTEARPNRLPLIPFDQRHCWIETKASGIQGV